MAINKVEVEYLNNYKTILRPLRRSIGLAWQYDKPRFLSLILITILIGSAVYLQYASFSRIVNDIIAIRSGSDAYASLIRDSAFLLLTFLIPSLLRQTQQYLQVLFRFRFLRNLNQKAIDEQSKLDIATVESSRFQDLLVKANSRGVMIIYQVIEQGIRNIENVSGILFASYFIIKIAPILFLVAIVTTAPSFYFYKKYGTQIWWIWDLNPQNRRKYFNRLSHFMNVLPLVEVKLFQLKSKFKEEITDLYDTFDNDLIKVEKRRYVWLLLIECLEVVGIAAVIWYLVRAGISGTILIGTLLLAFNSYRGLYNTLQSFFIVLGYQDEFGKYASWWFDLFDLQPKVTSNTNALQPVWETPPEIIFENVSFTYDEGSKEALRNINLTVRSGEKIAIVGLNGAGKTSLIRLLCRVYDPSEGRITVNGVDLRKIDLKHWQKQLGVLFQDFVNYNMTVAEAIALGDVSKPLDIDRVKRAADKATATGFIMEYPKGFDQLLWKGFEDGVEPSKGERQKIAVARVFYRDAMISVLDEPTSAIDAPSEDHIFEELESLPDDRTAFLISHRMSAVRNADNIIVLKDGAIVESGAHAELINLKREYYTLFTTQTKRMSLEELV